MKPNPRWLFAPPLLLILVGCNLPSSGIPTTQPVVSTSVSTTPARVSSPASTPIQGDLVSPDDLEYLGAFRLPDDGGRPYTFEYGGNAMTFRPGGDPNGDADGFPGSLFISGHDRLPYDELPDGSQVAEISIPAPLQATSPVELNTATFLQGFADVAAGFFTGLDEIPRLGMAYLDSPATGPLIHLSWGQHLQPDPPAASHAWFSSDLSNPQTTGEWFLDDLPLDSVNGYLFTIPADWANAYTSGRLLAAGRFRDGGWSGMGPSLITYLPWVDEAGTPAAPLSHLEVTTLLLYESSINTPFIERTMQGYQHPDEWEGGAWLTTSSGKSVVLFAGTKSVGEKYWYGWVNPASRTLPCIEAEMLGQYQLCYLADGSECPAEDLTGCSGHNDYRGWWTTRFEARIIFYNPADLARVALGELEPWQPQPYATLSIDDLLFHNPQGVEADMLGTGEQRRFRIGDVAYDQENDLLYILELFADGAKPVVHAWRLH
jgi:hypothetical protein